MGCIQSSECDREHLNDRATRCISHILSKLKAGFLFCIVDKVVVISPRGQKLSKNNATNPTVHQTLRFHSEYKAPGLTGAAAASEFKITRQTEHNM